MAQSSFRDRLNDLGWTRRDEPVNTSQGSGFYNTISKYNPFSGDGGVRLPTTEGEAPGAPLPARTRREEEEGWFALSRWDRLLVFAGLNVGAAVLFLSCFIFWAPLLLNPKKFAILWTFASIMFLASWAVLMGPLVYARHLLSAERLPFTATYLGSIALTLYFAVGLKVQLLTILAAIVQLVALTWYLVSYFPMGSAGLRMAASFGTSRVQAWFTG